MLVPMPGIENLGRLKVQYGNGQKCSQIMKYVPKSKQAAIKSAWCDDDGYWITLNEGYINGNMGGHTIHEWNIVQLRKEIAAIETEK